ncbi:MAG: amidohydrolase [Fimbriimonadaceae bacterium]
MKEEAVVYRNAHDPLRDETRDVWVVRGRIAEGPVPGARAVDLRGAPLRPKFVDPHAHVLPMGLDLVRPSVAGCASREEILDRLRDALNLVARGDWLVAAGYDPNRLSESESLSLDDLDRLSTDVPIVLRHVSGHGSLVNSAVLRIAGIDDQTPDPPGGRIGRRADGRPNGWLLERAQEALRKVAPKEDVETMARAVLRACQKLSEMGIGTVADMMTGYYDLRRELRAYALAARRGCPVRLRLYLQWSAVFGPKARHGWEEDLVDADPSRCRVAGIKVFADGALGARTAAIRGAYLGDPTPPSGWSGVLTYRPARLREMVRRAHEAGWSVAIHAIGDHALDLAMQALRETGEPSRHRIEHAMIADERQIGELARLGCRVCVQPEFLADFAEAYAQSLGPERMARLNPLGSMHRAGVRLCLGSDRPICKGDPEDYVRLATHRPPGFDPEERLDPRTAYAAATKEAAAALGDADLGSLEPGSWADLLADPASGLNPSERGPESRSDAS